MSKELLEELRLIRKALVSNQTDYCTSEEAARIMGLSNTRYLKQLYLDGVLPRYNRGDGYRYKKTDCYKVAAMLDSNAITLKPLTKNYS